MEKQHFVRRFTRTITFKFVLIGIISLLLLIPASWVKSLIREREQRSGKVFSEISSMWGYAQDITGPWLTIPYKSWHDDGEKKVMTIERMHFLPENLSVEASLVPEIRYRGIFKVIVYKSKVKIAGNFVRPDFSHAGINPENILWDQATLSLGITDMRGIRNNVEMNWNGVQPDIIPGIEDNDLASSGFHCIIDPDSLREGPVEFNTILELAGTKSFQVYPVGKTTRVNISSAWPDPGFTGAFLPVERKVSPDGFTANWLITHLNRNYPQYWTGQKYNISSSLFGVDLINPVDHYRQSTRSVKYAFMFIGLTFLLFILIEILNKKRLHPIQYILTGFALVIFYSLLVSLSEHIGFSPAYLVSSLAVVGLISYYIKASLGKMKYALLTFLVLSALFLFLYVVLRMQDFALLMGSTGLFIVLGLFMFLTRKINWYKEESAEDSENDK